MKNTNKNVRNAVSPRVLTTAAESPLKLSAEFQFHSPHPVSSNCSPEPSSSLIDDPSRDEFNVPQRQHALASRLALSIALTVVAFQNVLSRLLPSPQITNIIKHLLCPQLSSSEKSSLDDVEMTQPYAKTA